jgi:hypothetical protein
LDVGSRDSVHPQLLMPLVEGRVSLEGGTRLEERNPSMRKMGCDAIGVLGLTMKHDEICYPPYSRSFVHLYHRNITTVIIKHTIGLSSMTAIEMHSRML